MNIDSFSKAHNNSVLFVEDDSLDLSISYSNSFKSNNNFKNKHREKEPSDTYRYSAQNQGFRENFHSQFPLDYSKINSKVVLTPSCTLGMLNQPLRYNMSEERSKQGNKYFMSNKKFSDSNSSLFPNIIPKRIIPRKEEDDDEIRIPQTFLARLEKTLKSNRQRAMQEDDESIKKRIINSEFVSPEKKPFDFTFS